MPTLTFTNGNDTYTVNAAGTYDLDFLAGDDRLYVFGGTSTTAEMGNGNDLVQLKAGSNTVYGGAGADRFDIWASDATVDGGADNDTINIRGGSGQTAYGGLGVDHFNFFANTTGVALDGGDGNDVFTGYNKTIGGTLYGGLGNDFYVLFTAGVTLAGGLGNDVYRVTVSSAATLTESVGQGVDSVQVSRGYTYTLPNNIEKLVVGSYFGSTTGTATLTGNGIANTIVGWSNAETMIGLAGNDVLNGKGGDDTLQGGDGADLMYGGTENDTLDGGAGNDTLNGMAGTDAMAGGVGNDTYYVNTLLDTVTEAIAAGTDTVRVSVTGYTLPDNVENGYLSGINIADLAGNELNNVIVGAGGNNLLDGYGGNDTINGGAGEDSLWGWDGNDTILGGTGADEILGGIGDDILNGGTGDDTMDGGDGNDTYYVDSASDTISEFSGGGTDTVRTTVTYALPGNVEDGMIIGGSGVGLAGNSLGNALFGNSGDNGLSGGGGDDYLAGAAGADSLIGDANNDTFDFNSVSDSVPGAGDFIADLHSEFGAGADDDFLDFTDIDANTAVAGDQAFAWTNTTPAANSMWVASATTGGDGWLTAVLQADVDGDTTPEFEITIHAFGGNFSLDDMGL